MSPQNAEAASSGHDSTAMTTTRPSRDVNFVPDTTWDEQAVYEMIENSPWRKALLIDGEIRWATSTGEPGSKVGDEGDKTWKVAQIGEFMYLAPKEPHESADTVQAANDKRVARFLDKVAADMVANSSATPPPEYDDIRAMLAENTSAVLALFTRDGLLATDVHGYVDNDFDNPGPLVSAETQYITRGYHSLVDREKDPVFERLDKLVAQLLVGDKDSGYESGGSEVSVDQCRESPAYPECGDGCWVRHLGSTPSLDAESSDSAADVLDLETTNVYAKIDPGFTRILVIEPGARSETIKCTLEPMEILGVQEQEEGASQRRLYEALSYTWGDATICRAIECNGQQFGVSQNLFDALLNIRLPSQSRTVWIDALCIDQTNDAEKSEQVQYMYGIYRAATRVIVWLGTEADDSDFVMSAMALVGRRSNRATLMRRDHDHECLVQLARLITGIDTLTKRPWFFRSWIRQEVAAAPRVTVRCGSKELPWNALKRSVNCLTRLRSKYVASRALFNGTDDEFDALIPPDLEQSHALSFLKKDWVIGQSLLARAGDIRSVWYYHTGGLLELLMTGRIYDATNARDKVYAVLGMAEVPLESGEPSSKSDDEKERPTMRVDYSSSVSEVYQHAAKYLVNRDHSLDILCILLTHRDATSNDLPSWTPDWRVPLSSRALYDSWDYVSYKWGASGFTQAEAQDQTDLGGLTVIGFEIARIEHLEMLSPIELPHLPERPTGSGYRFEEGKHLRRFAQSSRGPAVVPAAAVVGDAIWILQGCKMPVMLRPAEALDEASFEVVGPCYVSTIMFGEALEWLEEGQIDAEVVSIKLV